MGWINRNKSGLNFISIQKYTFAYYFLWKTNWTNVNLILKAPANKMTFLNENNGSKLG